MKNTQDGNNNRLDFVKEKISELYDIAIAIETIPDEKYRE